WTECSRNGFVLFRLRILNIQRRTLNIERERWRRRSGQRWGGGFVFSGRVVGNRGGFDGSVVSGQLSVVGGSGGGIGSGGFVLFIGRAVGSGGRYRFEFLALELEEAKFL